ncbi:transaldolase [Reinekea blandensis]|uniref:Transaldolase n=1 Tax=Reinekea blandensis MED297 TaxID=314283 RepID=A4BHM0_9GAMM|nr:transaldolase [Reinekea blandensis]EAR08418.1 transaldolase [Reinekea blandensis MED297]
MNQLEQLKKITKVVADTGELAAIETFKPQDATTNPSLILKAIQSGQYDHLLEEFSPATTDVEDFIDKLGVEIGDTILKLVPGYVSTEVNARLSFDTEQTLAKARKLIELYEAKGHSRDRILIKIASTWEGIQAARVLEKEGIHCNLTLLFCMEQAQACADANVTLISPFVGRILDWYKKETGETYTGETDPGVVSVREIYQRYKTHGYQTIVMGASFRNKDEILALAGCDRLTISPALLTELAESDDTVKPALSMPAEVLPPRAEISESEFRLGLNQNAMATEKLAEGIRNFIADHDKLVQLLKNRT